MRPLAAVLAGFKQTPIPGVAIWKPPDKGTGASYYATLR